MPVKTGIQRKLDSGFRRNDGRFFHSAFAGMTGVSFTPLSPE